MTPSAPQKVQVLHLRTSKELDRYEDAATCRDAALLFLTNGRCRAKNLSGMPCADWEVAKHTKAVQEFKFEVKEYNAAEHVFLAHDGYLERMERRPARERTLKPHERIRFGVAESELIERADAHIKVQEWAESVHVRKNNILLSAPAGYGKSHVIKNVLRPALEKQYGKKGVWVTASTGLAALALEGVTIHSAAGLKRGNGKAQDIVNGMKAAVKNRWRLVKAIVIEEFSMLSADFLDLLDEVARIMKKAKDAFGGVLIVLVGDLAQLAPVPDFQANNDPEGPKWMKIRADYAFDSRVWARANFLCFRLTHCWRYDINGRLGKFLSALRLTPVLTDELYEEMKALLLNRDVDVNEAVVLCCRKKDARVWSVSKLKCLDGPEVIYYGVDKHGDEKRVNSLGNEDDDLHDTEEDQAKIYYDEHERTRSLFSGMPSPPVLRLRVGAKVLCTHKIDQDVRVGCMGVVVAFRDAAENVQDSMLSSYDMGYGMDQTMAKEDWGCVQLERLWPLVEFNVNGRQIMRTVFPALMSIEDNLGTLICSRMQLPLILSYSLTVHRAQGMTLDAVAFNMQGLFAEGQLYTALSRVCNFEKLRLMGPVLKQASKCANKKVLAFEANTQWRLIDNGPEEIEVQVDDVS